MKISLTFDWLHILAGVGVLALVYIVGVIVYGIVTIWMFGRGMRR